MFVRRTRYGFRPKITEFRHSQNRTEFEVRQAVDVIKQVREIFRMLCKDILMVYRGDKNEGLNEEII